MNAAIDAVVALLLISAAVGVVVTGGTTTPEPEPDRADATADAVAATTATVNYSLVSGVRELNRSAGGTERRIRAGNPELHRTTHGSLAGLLARAATASSGVVADGESGQPEREPLTRTWAGFRRAVRDAVRARVGARVRIDAVWRPYPDAPVGGRVGVGPEPPGDGVHAATLTIPTGVEPVPVEATVAFETLGHAVAARTVEILVPQDAARVTLRGDDPEASLLAHRYTRLARATNASVSGPLATEDTDAANARLTDALATRMTAALRAEYDSPSRAADAVSVSSVRIVVRTWAAGGA
ncbi:DUF7284 family protein [Halobellus ruber]|nr:hypothetical protein [Halobellus ruber]